MITPRTTRLWRVPDLRAMHAAIARLTSAAAPRSCAVIVPTRGAAEELRRTLENLRLAESAAAMLLPDLVTRDDFYSRLHERLPDAPLLLSAFDREVMLRRAALEAAAEGLDVPFQIRAGLIVEALAFYDELRRRNQSLDDFERLMMGSLEPSADSDHGAARMLRQTRFLGAALGRFEQQVASSGRVDEHGLRTLLLGRACAPPYRHVVVTTADQAAEAHGLWPADLDLLARLPAVDVVDVVATEALLAAGFYDRVHQAFPEMQEDTHGVASPPPVLSAPHPPAGEEGLRWFVYRDREEELVAVARAIRGEEQGGDAHVERAVAFQRPLPYLYLARHVFADAGVPYQALDSLPLAAEPFVAALDLVFTFLIGDGTRASLIALLRSPHWTFEANGSHVEPRQINAADDLLQRLKYLGDFERLSSIAEEAVSRAAADSRGGRRQQLWITAAPALTAAAAAARELRTLASAASAVEQLGALLTFIKSHERLPAAAEPWRSRHLRARGAVLAALESLRDAHAAYDNRPLPVPDLAASIRRWVEGQIFAPVTGRAGVRLLDAQAAPYAQVDDLRIVGLVESDWPERQRRSIFYPASLLTQLGWPSDTDRLTAARARFQDLLTLPRTRVSASAFTLEDDAIVPPSSFLDDIDAAGLAVERVRPASSVRVLAREALTEMPIVPAAVSGSAAEWLALRTSRTPDSGPRTADSGQPTTDAGQRTADGGRRTADSGPRTPYAVSYVERYLECPFKYFATHVLQLPEERDDETGLTPLERGQLLHDVFEGFFDRWHSQGRRAITAENVADALALFETVAEEKLAQLGEADRTLERTHLLGSAVSAGLAERAFAFEIDHQADLFERLLEYELEGEFEFRGAEGTRTVHVRSKADRIDLLSDGTLRVIDYKLGRAPKKDRALQLSVYGACAEQRLKGHAGRDWKLARAAYVAFREKNPYVPLGGTGSLEDAVAEGQARFLQTIDAIEAGTFAVDPAEPYRCQWCAYPTVCRKDYVGDE